MTSTPEIDQNWPDAAWPAPVPADREVQPSLDLERLSDRPTRQVPVDPGQWGRPAASPRTVAPAWSPVTPPPAPPSAVAPTSSPAPDRQPIGRRELGRVPIRRLWLPSRLIELAAGAAILVAVALISPGGSPTDVSARGLSAWGQAGVPVITDLVDDLGAVQRATSPGTTPSPPTLARVSTQLERDVAAARSLPAPPSGPVAQDWTETLRLLGSGSAELQAAVPHPDPSAVAGARRLLDAAGAGLLQVGEEVQSGG